MILRLPIDVKSLYLNIKNDNEKGHTQTVATPLKQGASIKRELSQLFQIPENIPEQSRESLISQILLKSRADVIIPRICVFDKIAVNGIPLNTTKSFCMYIREETAITNVHYGRQKVHYPISLKYEDENVSIDNKHVLSFVSQQLNNYAFIVEAFEYDTQSRVINFDAVIVGENSIPYSKVFINKRGVGVKFTDRFFENVESYDKEIISMRDKLGYDNVDPSNYFELIEKQSIAAAKIVTKHLVETGCTNIRNLKLDYPYALFDLEYIENGIKKYAIIKHTTTKTKYFSLNITQIQFCNDFINQASLFLITDILGDYKINKYTMDDLLELDKQINSITYNDRS